MKNYRIIISFAVLASSWGCSPPASESSSDSRISDEHGAIAPVIMPDTDIFVAALSFENDWLSISEPENVTARSGYDNQPSFIPESAAFYYSSEGESGKTDVWKFDISGKRRTEISFSPDVSEYSPRSTPDRSFISYIQENAAGDVTEVHKRPAAGGEGEAVTDFAPLGYYAWSQDGSKLAVYMRSEPASLHVVDVESGETVLVEEDIGRALYAAGDSDFAYFTTARKDGGFQVNRLDFQSLSVSPLFALVGKAEDYAVIRTAGRNTPHAFLCAEGGVVYYRRSMFDEDGWTQVADLSRFGLTNISRMAVSDNGEWLALVAEVSR